VAIVDPLTAVVTAFGTLAAGLATGAFIPRWVVTWLVRTEREAKGEAIAAKTEAVEALRIERQRGDVQARQLDKLLDKADLSTAALASIERQIAARAVRDPVHDQEGR
jgi:hypothetical protein